MNLHPIFQELDDIHQTLEFYSSGQKYFLGGRISALG